MTATTCAPTGVRSIPTADGTATVVTSYGDPRAASAVFLCHGFIQNASAWTVPSRSLITALVDDGHAVHALALRGREGFRPTHSLQDYVDHDVPAVVDAFATPSVHLSWVGHSMGGLIGATLPSSTASRLERLVLLGAPLIPGRRILHQPGVAQVVRAFGRRMAAREVPFAGRAYGAGFVRARKLLERMPRWPLHLWRPGAFADDADLRAILEQGFAYDSHAVLADLVDLIASDGTRAGRLPVTARLRALQAPLLAFAGTDDALAPPESVRALVDRAGSPQKTIIEVPAGHIDLVVGDRAPAEVWAPLRAFLNTRQ